MTQPRILSRLAGDIQNCQVDVHCHPFYSLDNASDAASDDELHSPP